VKTVAVKDGVTEGKSVGVGVHVRVGGTSVGVWVGEGGRAVWVSVGVAGGR
jgi:hypothetical protein